MVAPTLTDNTWQFTDTGVVLNPDSNSFPLYDVTSVQGLDNAPFRTSERDTEGIDGGVVESEFETIRTIIIDGVLYGGTSSALNVAIEALKGNFGPSTLSQPLYFKLPGLSQRLVYCKSFGLKTDITTASRYAAADFQVQLKAADPTIYSSLLNSTSSSLPPATQVGRGYPKVYPKSYGGVTTSGIIGVTNVGNKPAPAVLTIPGPVTNPIVTNDTDGGKYLKVLISLGSSDTITIDLKARTVVLNGTGNRRYLLAAGSKWFQLLPGTNNLRYSAQSQTGSVLSITWRDAYR